MKSCKEKHGHQLNISCSFDNLRATPFHLRLDHRLFRFRRVPVVVSKDLLRRDVVMGRVRLPWQKASSASLLQKILNDSILKEASANCWLSLRLLEPFTVEYLPSRPNIRILHPSLEELVAAAAFCMPRNNHLVRCSVHVLAAPAQCLPSTAEGLGST